MRCRLSTSERALAVSDFVARRVSTVWRCRVRRWDSCDRRVDCCWTRVVAGAAVGAERRVRS